MAEPADPPRHPDRAAARAAPVRVLSLLWHEALLPLLVLLGLLAIAVALTEGQSSGDFLYAIF
jgi:hypothetical protein